MRERLAAVEVCIVEQLRLEIDRGSGSIPCEARHVGSVGTVGGRFWVGGSGAEDGRASLQTDRQKCYESFAMWWNAKENRDMLRCGEMIIPCLRLSAAYPRLSIEANLEQV